MGTQSIMCEKVLVVCTMGKVCLSINGLVAYSFEGVEAAWRTKADKIEARKSFLKRFRAIVRFTKTTTSFGSLI